MSKTITIDECGRCAESGTGGLGRYGERAAGKIIAADIGSEDGVERLRIVSVGSTIHTGGGSNYVYATVERA